MKTPLLGFARSLWLKMTNRAAGKAAAQMRRESLRGKVIVAANKTKPAARASAKTARKAAQTTRRKSH